MFDILPPLFMRGDHFAMREYQAAQVTSVFFALKIDDRFRWFHSYCDLSRAVSIDRMRAGIVGRESSQQLSPAPPAFGVLRIWARGRQTSSPWPKAIASGDERLMQKAGLEAEIARLDRLRAAHIDDKHAIRRQIRDAERDIELAGRRIEDVGKDIERLIPTAGDAFTMQVGGAEFDERKLAGRALMKEILSLVQLQQEKEVIIAKIGGFHLAYHGERFGKDGDRYDTLLQRTGGDYESDLAVTTTPIGAISRLEHALGGFEQERENHRIRLVYAERRLASYTPRLGERFSFEAELELKLSQLDEIERDLAATADEPEEDRQEAA
jgi:hypothetical protein